QRLSRRRMVLRVTLQGSVQALEVWIAKFLRNGEHLSFITFHLIQTDLVDLGGRFVGSCAPANGEGVVVVSAWKCPGAGLLAPGCNVLCLKETGEALVRRQHAGGDRIHHLLSNALLICRRNRCREFLQRPRKGAIGWLLLRQVVS